MPTFDYRCTKCAHETEHFFHSVSSIVDQTCPKCGAPMVKLVGKILGFKFKNRAGMFIRPGGNDMDSSKTRID